MMSALHSGSAASPAQSRPGLPSGFSAPQECDSQGHRRNILNCDSVAIGVGAVDSERGIYWTQVFGYE
jgi:hypothetical protein